MWGIGIFTCPAIGQLAYDIQQKEKRMKALQLTTIAALPQGGGCMAALPAEVGEQPTAQDWKQATADLAFDSFIDLSRIAIDLGPIGGDGPKEWPALEGGYGC